MNGNIASIDLGLNNLAPITYNNGYEPEIVNGRPLKSINQFYNKKKAYFQSKLQGDRKTSKKICKLTCKKNKKIKNCYSTKNGKNLCLDGL